MVTLGTKGLLISIKVLRSENVKGREKFKKFEKIINILSIFSLILPNFLFKFLYELSSISDNKLSILIRYLYVRKYAKSCGKNVYVGSHVILKNLHEIEFGSNISLHSFSYVDGAGSLEIGNNVSIATNTSIITFDHTWEDINLPIKYNNVIYKKIVIKDDVWIGANVKILGNITINERAIVAAGAVVNKDVVSHTLVGGVPIKLLKHI